MIDQCYDGHEGGQWLILMLFSVTEHGEVKKNYPKNETLIGSGYPFIVNVQSTVLESEVD